MITPVEANKLNKHEISNAFSVISTSIYHIFGQPGTVAHIHGLELPVDWFLFVKKYFFANTNDFKDLFKLH
jgi:hypothetical protein